MTKEVDAKSIMSVLLSAAPAVPSFLKINGDDEAAALQAMTELFANGFGELEGHKAPIRVDLPVRCRIPLSEALP